MKEDSATNEDHLKKLIVQAKNGNAEAFEEVYAHYYTPLFRYVFNRTRNKHASEDITQTVFVKVWKALPTHNEHHTSPTAFFFTVARTTLIDFFRKKSTHEIVSDEIIARNDTLDETAQKDISAQEQAEELKKAIICLSEEQQEIVSLMYTHDLSYKEIAEITGKREDAIRQIHSRAIKKLRTLYKEHI